MLPLFLLAPTLLAATPLVTGQSSSDKLPPANPLPPSLPGADADTAAAMAPVARLLAAIAARDSAAVLATARPDAVATASVERPDGTHSLTRTPWAEFAANIRPGRERYEERLTDPVVEVEGDIAVVWSPYIFLVDNRPQHCGTDHFSVVREGGRWQVASVTWTQRTTGCTLP